MYVWGWARIKLPSSLLTSAILAENFFFPSLDAQRRASLWIKANPALCLVPA
jgi:hypothetical protein